MITLFILHSKTKNIVENAHCAGLFCFLNHIIFENRHKIMALFKRLLFEGFKELLLFSCPDCVQTEEKNYHTSEHPWKLELYRQNAWFMG